MSGDAGGSCKDVAEFSLIFGEYGVYYQVRREFASKSPSSESYLPSFLASWVSRRSVRRCSVCVPGNDSFHRAIDHMGALRQCHGHW